MSGMLRLNDFSEVQMDCLRFMDSEFRFKMVLAFRGFGKSSITCWYALWKLFLNPDEKIAVVSATLSRAVALTFQMRALIRHVDFLNAMSPKKHQRDCRKIFDVADSNPSKDASVTAFGIDSQLTGSRASLLIADDMEIPGNSGTRNMREKLLDKMNEFIDLLSVGGGIVVLGTPQSNDSVYGDLASKGFEVRVAPAIVPESAERTVGELFPSIVQMTEDSTKIGTPADVRHSSGELALKKNMRGDSGWLLQYELVFGNSERTGSLRILDILFVRGLEYRFAPVLKDRVLESTVAWREPVFVFSSERGGVWDRKIVAVDPSGNGSCHTAATSICWSSGKFFVVDSEIFSEGYSRSALLGIADMARRLSADEIVVEKNFGDGMFEALLTEVTNVRIVSVRSHGPKSRRILDVLEPAFGSGKLFVSLDSVLRDRIKRSDDRFLEQIASISEDYVPKKSDRVDSLAIGVSYLHSKMHYRQSRVARSVELRKRSESRSSSFFASSRSLRWLN